MMRNPLFLLLLLLSHPSSSWALTIINHLETQLILISTTTSTLQQHYPHVFLVPPFSSDKTTITIDPANLNFAVVVLVFLPIPRFLVVYDDKLLGGKTGHVLFATECIYLNTKRRTLHRFSLHDPSLGPVLPMIPQKAALNSPAHRLLLSFNVPPLTTRAFLDNHLRHLNYGFETVRKFILNFQYSLLLNLHDPPNSLEYYHFNSQQPLQTQMVVHHIFDFSHDLPSASRVVARQTLDPTKQVVPMELSGLKPPLPKLKQLGDKTLVIKNWETKDLLFIYATSAILESPLVTVPSGKDDTTSILLDPTDPNFVVVILVFEPLTRLIVVYDQARSDQLPTESVIFTQGSIYLNDGKRDRFAFFQKNPSIGSLWPMRGNSPAALQVLFCFNVIPLARAYLDTHFMPDFQTFLQTLFHDFRGSLKCIDANSEQSSQNVGNHNARGYSLTYPPPPQQQQQHPSSYPPPPQQQQQQHPSSSNLQGAP